MTNQHNNAQVASKPFALICSFQVPTTELDPDLIPSVSVVVGAYETLEQAKHVFCTIKHPAFIGGYVNKSMLLEDYQANTAAKNGGMQ